MLGAAGLLSSFLFACAMLATAGPASASGPAVRDLAVEDASRALVLDLFRVKDGKIVEHWDAIQDVPEEAANANTMF